ncbi:Ni/Fe hydrogenase subunit alpha [Methylocaldum szegediense]|uniref:Sulfhydrogenase subunit alpha n=1 Tax=Methylocaldum szegediense TaxID=73780 RepID=A0ABM9I4U2_9GAMM|nr:nickel-dependent hydrogenase large subunit [Methylocaldum szegediense]CAI8892727.1 sulfhydrogenase subunit alpha [Methylocaldum szegediense]
MAVEFKSERQAFESGLSIPARREGDAVLDLRIRGTRIESLALQIFEQSRLLAACLEGRPCFDVPDTVARICGTGPVAQQMSAVQGLESALGCRPTAWIQAMRRVMCCGEWIASHTLHIYLLAAPDFLGFPSLAEMSRDFPDEVRRGLRLYDLGCELVRLFRASSSRSAGIRIGGFYHAPSKVQVRQLVERLRAALEDAEGLVAWAGAIDLPRSEQAFIEVALSEPNAYPMFGGWIVFSIGSDIAAENFETHFHVRRDPYSKTDGSSTKGRSYLTGPLARLNLNLDRLPGPVADALRKTGIAFPSRNIFHSIVARAAEVYFALTEAIRLLDGYEPQPSYVDARTGAGIGFGCTEAPQGILRHRYELDVHGRVMRARIVSPAMHNQARIEEDLWEALQAFGTERTDEELRLHGQRVIRNYDPCIACSTDFLQLNVVRC